MPTRTRIVATLGPSTDRPGVLEGMLRAGLDVARINFSHGSADEHRGRIAGAAEADLREDGWEVVVPRGPIDDQVTHLTCTLARDVGAEAIVVPAVSGRTARLVARHRPRAVVVAASPREEVLRQLCLVWGLLPVPMPGQLRPGEDLMETAVRAAREHGTVQEGQLVVVLAGHPVEGGDRFPTIRVVRVGEGGRSLTP
ncbi:MAG TPA: pyruvate kinase [Gemmataceae bacterium]|nr:pyruvate kinase [Gemmataceae bacterium]